MAATYTWSIPSGQEINGSTKIKEADNKISNIFDDLVDFVNGEGIHNGQGLTYDLVTKNTTQTITGDKVFSGTLTGTLTGNASSSSSCSGNSATATLLSAGADRIKLDGIETGATADQTKADIDALNINASTVNGLTVGTAVPTGAVFTDTVYTLPAATQTVRGGVQIYTSGGNLYINT